MNFKIFLIGALGYALICAAVVFFSWRKKEDWKMVAAFMLIGWLIACGQLAGNLK